MPFKFLLILFACAILSEILIRRLLFFLRKDFQWLLIDVFDEVPKINKESLQRFLKHGYDSQLGWVRKPNTSGMEIGKSVGESSAQSQKRTNFHMNDRGARLNPGHEHLPHLISTYGDSYTFCRQVEDAETWQWHLSEWTHSNVSNWGVGNYGLDQALLRIKNEFRTNPSSLVLIGVVPETLIRILSVWKHYVEYGNTLGIKPRYELKEGKLRLLRNLMDESSKFNSLETYIPEFKRQDYWYQNKFKKDMLRIPYGLSLMRNPSRHLPLIASLCLRLFVRKLRIKGDFWESLPWNLILKRNFDSCVALYQNSEACHLFEAIIEEFSLYAQEQGFTPGLIFFPYLHDLSFLSKKGNYYRKLLERIKHKILSMDLADKFLGRRDWNDLYLNDYYGAHLSPLGNRLAAESIYASLNENHLLDNHAGALPVFQTATHAN